MQGFYPYLGACPPSLALVNLISDLELYKNMDVRYGRFGFSLYPKFVAKITVRIIIF